jgi:hypothetical protein
MCFRTKLERRLISSPAGGPTNFNIIVSHYSARLGDDRPHRGLADSTLLWDSKTVVDITVERENSYVHIKNLPLVFH